MEIKSETEENKCNHLLLEMSGCEIEGNMESSLWAFFVYGRQGCFELDNECVLCTLLYTCIW